MPRACRYVPKGERWASGALNVSPPPPPPLPPLLTSDGLPAGEFAHVPGFRGEAAAGVGGVPGSVGPGSVPYGAGGSWRDGGGGAAGSHGGAQAPPSGLPAPGGGAALALVALLILLFAGVTFTPASTRAWLVDHHAPLLSRLGLLPHATRWAGTSAGTYRTTPSVAIDDMLFDAGGFDGLVTPRRWALVFLVASLALFPHSDPLMHAAPPHCMIPRLAATMGRGAGRLVAAAR